MSIYYVDGKRLVAKVALIPDLETLRKYPDMTQVFLQGMAPKSDVPWKDVMYVIGDENVICYRNTIYEEAERIAYTKEVVEEKSQLDYVNTRFTINSQIVHEYFDLTTKRDEWYKTLSNAYELTEYLIKKSNQELLTTDDFYDFPHELLEWKWPIENTQWQLLIEELKKSYVRAKKGELEDPLHAIRHTLKEHFTFVKRTEPHTYFVSLLRSTSFNDCILMALMSWNANREKNPHTLSQYHIVQFPSIWLYKLMHPGCCIGLQRISILMHSITSWAAQKVWPSAQKFEVAQPFPMMRRILENAAKEHKFPLYERYGSFIIPYSEKYINLWKTKWAENIQNRICAVCWSIDAAWQCGAGRRCQKHGQLHYYCSSECARFDWTRHSLIDHK